MVPGEARVEGSRPPPVPRGGEGVRGGRLRWVEGSRGDFPRVRTNGGYPPSELTDASPRRVPLPRPGLLGLARACPRVVHSAPMDLAQTPHASQVRKTRATKRTRKPRATSACASAHATGPRSRVCTDLPPRVACPCAVALTGTSLATGRGAGVGGRANAVPTGIGPRLRPLVAIGTPLASCRLTPAPNQAHAQPAHGTFLAGSREGEGGRGMAGGSAIAGEIQRQAKDPSTRAGDEKPGSHHCADRRTEQMASGGLLRPSSSWVPSYRVLP